MYSNTMKKLLILGDPKGTHAITALRKYNAEDITVWENDSRHIYTIKQIDGRINVTTDLQELVDKGMKFDVVIGNPPYGNRGSLAVQFLNKSLELSDDVRMILPLSFTKPSITNQVSLNHICVDEIELPETTFPNGIKAVRQRWIPSDTPRQKIILPTSHSDFEFVKYEERFDADLMIGAVGSGPSGKVKTENFTHYQPKHHFIKCKSEEIKNRLISLQPILRELSKQQNGRGGVCKSDIVTHYVNSLEGVAPE